MYIRDIAPMVEEVVFDGLFDASGKPVVIRQFVKQVKSENRVAVAFDAPKEVRIRVGTRNDNRSIPRG